MMQKFLQGDKNLAYQTLGIPYGYLFFEGCEHYHIFTMAYGRQILQEMVEREIIDSDTAADMEAQMRQAGLLENWEAVRAKAAAYTPPSDFKPRFQFKMCEDKECAVKAMPHGFILKIDDDENRWIDGVTHFVDGLDKVGNLGDDSRAIDSAVLIVQIADSALPIDDDARRTMFNALPEEVRQEIMKKKAENYRYELVSELAETASFFSFLADIAKQRG